MYRYLPEKRASAARLARSLKVIGTDTNQAATYDFLLVTMSVSLTLLLFPRKMVTSVKNYNFFSPCVLNAPAKGVPIGIL